MKVRVKPTAAEAFRAEAEARGMSPSAAMREALSEWMKMTWGAL